MGWALLLKSIITFVIRASKSTVTKCDESPFTHVVPNLVFYGEIFKCNTVLNDPITIQLNFTCASIKVNDIVRGFGDFRVDNISD